MRYKRIESSNYRNIYITGDLHGCYNELMTALKSVKFSYKQDLLITVGDFIDKGEDSLKMLMLTKQKWFASIRGNHEQSALNSLNGNKQSLYNWMLSGGEWYFKLSDSDQKLANSLFVKMFDMPVIIEITIANKTWVFAHADYPEDYNFDKAVTNKQVMRSNRQTTDKEIAGADYFVFGHIPQKEITVKANRLYIDTGAYLAHKVILTKIK